MIAGTKWCAASHTGCMKHFCGSKTIPWILISHPWSRPTRRYSIVYWQDLHPEVYQVRGLEEDSSTLAWKIPWMEGPGGLQSMESLGVRHDWATSLYFFHFHALEKEMATHSTVLAWRIPRTGEPGGLPSLGSHRVGHDWSDLAAAAAAGLMKRVPYASWPFPEKLMVLIQELKIQEASCRQMRSCIWLFSLGLRPDHLVKSGLNISTSSPLLYMGTLVTSPSHCVFLQTTICISSTCGKLLLLRSLILHLP